jgi:hypothetical protein
MAASGIVTSRIHRLGSVPAAERSPAVKSRESPGSRSPTSSPDSMNTIARTPMVPNVSIKTSGSSQLGPTATGDAFAFWPCIGETLGKGVEPDRTINLLTPSPHAALKV